MRSWASVQLDHIRCRCGRKACLSSPPMLAAGSMSHCSGVEMVEHVDELQPMAIDVERAVTPARCRCGRFRWPLSLPSTTHTAPARHRPSPMWPVWLVWPVWPVWPVVWPVWPACLSSPPMLAAGSMSHCSGVEMVEHVDELQPMAIDVERAVTPARCRCGRFRWPLSLPSTTQEPGPSEAGQPGQLR